MIGRHQLHDHHAHDGLDGVAATLEHAGEAAGLALEMEAERELVHVLEGAVGEPAHRVHRHLRENTVAHLGEHRHQDAHAAIRDGHEDRRGEHPEQPGGRGHRCAVLPGERIGRPFEGERHRDGRELGGQQKHHRSGDAKLEIAPIGRPEIGPQPTHDGEQRAALGGHLPLQCFARSQVWIRHRNPC